MKISATNPNSSSDLKLKPDWNRRQFLGGALVAAASASGLSSLAAEGAAGAAKPAEFSRKIKLGIVGCGGRGSWIAKFFKQHGGYEIHAVADYFEDSPKRVGDELGVDAARRFSGLSGYKKLIESGVEAVVIESIPCFHPEHARAAVEAGCHVYLAKPIATDVPGCLQIEAAGKLASSKQRCFLVDFQIPTDPVNIEVMTRIREGGLGELCYINTVGSGGLWGDPEQTPTIESRLRNGKWLTDVSLSGDHVVEFAIHAIDAGIGVVGKRPLAAMGHSQIRRRNPHGNSHDFCVVEFEFEDKLVWSHRSMFLNNNDGGINCTVFGQDAMAFLTYSGKAYLRGGSKHFGGGNVESLYDSGAKRNIATFYQNIVDGHFENTTVPRAVDSNLTAILAREAASRHGRLTMEELIKENKKLEVNLTGLKA